MRWPYIARVGEYTHTRNLGIPKGFTSPDVLYRVALTCHCRVIEVGGSQKRIVHSFGGPFRDCYNRWVQTNETPNVMPVRNTGRLSISEEDHPFVPTVKTKGVSIGYCPLRAELSELYRRSTNIPTCNFSAISRICRKGRGQKYTKMYLWYTVKAEIFVGD